VDCGLILDKNKGPFAKWRGIIGFELFSNGKRRGLSPRFVDHGRCRSTVDQGQGLSGGLPELSLTAAPGHGGLPRGWQREEGDAARLGDRSPEPERRHTSGETSAPSDDDVGMREEGRR
jgi:hypothetical protein